MTQEGSVAVGLEVQPPERAGCSGDQFRRTFGRGIRAAPAFRARA
jgi:hypothetical protein